MKTIAVTSAILLSAASIDAAEIFKANNNDDLNLASSWVGGAVPGAGDIAQWPLVPTGNMASDIGAPWSVAGIVVTNGADSTGYNNYNVSINGSDTLTLGKWGIDYNGKKNLTVNTPISVAADQTWSCQGGGSLTIANTVALNGHVVAFAGGNTKEVKGLFSGAGTLFAKAATIKMSSGSAAPDADARIVLGANVSFDQTPAANGVYRFRNITLDGTGSGDGAFVYANGPKNENGHDRISGTLSVESGNGNVALDEDAVPAIAAAPHDEVGGDGVFPVGGFADHDAPSDVAVVADQFRDIVDLVNVHFNSPYI